MNNKALRKCGIFIASMAMVISGINCSVANPVAPSWEVDVKIPLFNNNVNIGDLLKLDIPANKGPGFPIMFEKAVFVSEVMAVDVTAAKGIFENGHIEYAMINRLGIGIDSATIFISRSASEVFQSPEIIIGPLSVAAAEVDDQGCVVNPSTTQLTRVLGHDEAKILDNESGLVYVGYSINVSGTDGQAIVINPQESLFSKASLSVKIKMN